MLGQVKFSEAISSIWPRCRSSSRPISSAISGSTSASPARRSSFRVCSATATPEILVPEQAVDPHAEHPRRVLEAETGVELPCALVWGVHTEHHVFAVLLAQVLRDRLHQGPPHSPPPRTRDRVDAEDVPEVRSREVRVQGADDLALLLGDER